MTDSGFPFHFSLLFDTSENPPTPLSSLSRTMDTDDYDVEVDMADVSSMLGAFVRRRPKRRDRTTRSRAGETKSEDSACYVRTEDLLYVWRMLGIESKGHEHVGVETLPIESALRLTRDGLIRDERELRRLRHRSSRSRRAAEEYAEERWTRLFRLLRGVHCSATRPSDTVERDALVDLAASCGVRLSDEEEARELFALACGVRSGEEHPKRSAALDLTSFLAFMRSRCPGDPPIQHANVDDEDEDEEDETRAKKAMVLEEAKILASLS